nr:hypothetical protein [Tanacetum cinerariifolium]
NHLHQILFLSLHTSEDDVLPGEEQPLPATVSPTVDSSGYITKSDPEEDDEDPEEDPTDYPIDKDDNDEEEESPGGDADDEVEDEGEDEEEEEHLALTDSVPPPAYRTSVRMSIRAQTHKMPQRKASRTKTTPATITAIATTPMTDAAISALIS